MTDDQKAFEAKWHMKQVRLRGIHWKLPIKDYVVTCALLKRDGDETVFAVMATDYTTENKHYITIRLASEQLSHLDEDFEIIGDYNPIQWEITMWVHSEPEIEGAAYWLADTKNHENGVETPAFPIPKAPPREIGRGIYDIAWTTTDGRKVRDTVAVPAEIAAQGHDAMREHFAWVRGWVRGCAYHWIDWRRMPNAPLHQEIGS